MFTGQLKSHGILLSAVTHINLYLNNMADFARINKIYSSYFAVSPPTRACVSIHLPSKMHLKLDGFGCTLSLDELVLPRTALHVQSLSYWAPANIGPYSQAVMVSPS